MNFCLVDCLPGLRWHVVFVVFGKDCLSIKHAIAANVSLSDATASLFKEVGKDSFVHHRNTSGGICNYEPNCQTVVVSLETALLNQTADSESPVCRRFLGSNLRGAEEKYEVILEGIQNQKRRDSETGKPRQNKENALMTSFHPCYFPGIRNPLASGLVCDATEAQLLHR